MKKQRILKLADHIETGELGHKEWNFAAYNNGWGKQDAINFCGYAGCGIGECPILWPKSWEFDRRNGSPVLIDLHKYQEDMRPSCLDDEEESGMEWFGITLSQFRHLFVPMEQDGHFGKFLKSTATRKEVAANMRKFVEMQP